MNLKGGESRRTPLACAAADGHSDCVQFLLRSGANINQTDIDRYTPLHLAVTFGHEECVKVLARDPNIDFKKRTGQTALEIAAENGDNDIVLSLQIFEEIQRRKLEGKD